MITISLKCRKCQDDWKLHADIPVEFDGSEECPYCGEESEDNLLLLGITEYKPVE